MCRAARGLEAAIDANGPGLSSEALCTTSRLEVEDGGRGAVRQNELLTTSPAVCLAICIIGDDAALNDGEATACQSSGMDARRSIEIW